MSQTSSAARKSGTMRAARSASLISVPRPGPSSTRRTGIGRAHARPHLGRPKADQLAEHLRDFRRGGEIARRAERIAVHVVAEIGMGERQLHVVLDRDRTRSGDQRLDFVEERRSSRDSPPAEAPREHTQGRRRSAARQDHAHRQPPPEVLEARIGLAKEFAEDARRAVEDAEHAGDQARDGAARPFAPAR